MDPAVFLTNPDSGAVKAFTRMARPAIRRWAENHYEYFRQQFPDNNRNYGSHRIEGGYLFRYHLLGEYSTLTGGQPSLIARDYMSVRSYPRMNSDVEDWLYTNQITPSYASIWLDSKEIPAAAIETDVQEGGQATYYMLPSLAKLLVDNIRLGQATPQQVSNFMAVTLMSFDDKQGKARGQNARRRSNLFDTVTEGSRDYYTFFNTFDTILRTHPEYAALAKAAGVNNLNVNGARSILSQMYDKSDGTAGLDNFRNIEFETFKKAMNAYLKPIVAVLTAVFPRGQVVSILDIKNREMERKAGGRISKNDRSFDNVREGQWRVIRSGRKNNKDVVDVESLVNNDILVKNVPVSTLIIPAGQDDLRTSSDLRSSPALPFFEAVVETFLYLDHVNCLSFTQLNHTRFTKNHFLKFDGTDSSHFDTRNENEGVFFGDWFIDARTDHTLAFFANMWDKNPKMRKSLENLFKDDNFILSEIQWYTDVIARHMNPVLIPQMQQRGIPTQAVLIAPVVPEDQQIQIVGDLTKVDLKLESPLLRDAYLSYSTRFNEWFSQLLIGTNRGYLFAEPFGPAGPGGSGKKAKKKVEAARQSMQGAVKEAWTMVRASIQSLRNIDIPEEEIIRVVQEQVVGAHARYGTSRPSLPPGGAKNLSAYLDFIVGLYERDPRMLAEVNTAADRLRIDRTKDINVVEDMFITDIKRHMKMKALGTQKFPALAVAIEILRTYLTVPQDALNEFVARELTDDMRAQIQDRAQTPQGFVSPPTPTVVPPRAPPILTMREGRP